MIASSNSWDCSAATTWLNAPLPGTGTGSLSRPPAPYGIGELPAREILATEQESQWEHSFCWDLISRWRGPVLFPALAETFGDDVAKHVAKWLGYQGGEASRLPPVAPFEIDFLPDKIGPWVLDIADRMQCPLDFVGILAMAALGSVLGRKVGIRPKQRSDWTVVSNIWGMIVGPPGALKSPAVEEACS